ncbi:MAG: phage tail sheath C-terminal domain-containing protein [Myxococcota bacterium]
MVSPSYPGVYISEVPSQTMIQGASTSVAAFVGATHSGPVDTPTLVTSWNEFTRTFGGLGWSSFTAWAVYGFFASGGAICYVVRSSDGNGAAARATVGAFEVTASGPGVWGNALSVSLSGEGPTTSLDVLVETSLLQADDAGLSARRMAQFARRNGCPTVAHDGKDYTVLESHALDGGSGALAAAKVTDTSMFVRVESLEAALAEDSREATLSGGTEPDGDVSKSVRTLDEFHDISLLALPDAPLTVDGDGKADSAAHGALIRDALDYCQESQRLFLVVASPSGLDVDEVLHFRQGRYGPGAKPLDSGFGALYYPWVWQLHPTTSRALLVPADGMVLGRYAATDTNVGVYKAPAGVTDGQLQLASGFETDVTDEQGQRLNPEGVNALRTMPGYGEVIWGARTLSRELDWVYVNVRRLVLYVEQSIRQSMQWVAFESNDERTRARLHADVSSFLTGLWQEGALWGTKASDAFFVTVDENNNPPQTRAQGVLILDVGIAPVRPAEFVVLRFSQQTQIS